jgi:hypothetical protein
MWCEPVVERLLKRGADVEAEAQRSGAEPRIVRSMKTGAVDMAEDYRVTFYTIFFLGRDLGVVFGQSSLIARQLGAKDG